MRSATTFDRRRTARGTWWAALAATLAVVPFEGRLQLAEVGGATLTAIHLTALVALLSWVATLYLEHRRPAVPRAIVIALAVAFGAGLASAMWADGHQDEALRTVVRSAGGWLLFVAVADMAGSADAATRMAAVIVASCAAAALIGLVLFVGPVDLTSLLLGIDFTVAGARRLQATFGYPTTASMAFEAATFVAIGLLGVARGRWGRRLVASAAVVLVAAAILTLSRGAALAFAGGFLTISLAAALAHRRRLAAGAVAAGVAVICAMALGHVASVPVERLLVDSERELFRATYAAPARVAAGGDLSARVPVTVTNTGAAGWRPGEVRLGHHWLDPVSQTLVAEGSSAVPLGEVPSGSTVTVDVQVTLPAGDARLAAAWDAIRSADSWFSELAVPVTISIVELDGSAPPTADGNPPQTLILFPGQLLQPTRSELWSVAVAMIREQPMLGVGPGTFRLRYGGYLGWSAWDQRIHANSLYLEVGATSGLIGLAALLTVVLYTLARQLRFLSGRAGPMTAGGPWLLSAGLAAAAVAFLAHGLVDHFLDFSSMAVLFWAIVGLGLGPVLGTERESTARDTTPR